MQTKTAATLGGFPRIAAALLLTLTGCSAMFAFNRGTDLVDSAYKGDLMAVKALLDSGVDLNARNQTFARTGLMAAAAMGHQEVIKLLLNRGVQVNAKDADGGTALIDAAGTGDPAIVQLLLDRGADVNAQTSQSVLGYLLFKQEGWSDDRATWVARQMGGETALIRASTAGSTEVVRLLLDHGAVVNAQKNNGTTALLVAAEKGNEAIVRLLISVGANVTVKTADGKTPIGEATKGRRMSVVEVLRNAGAKE